MKHVQTILTLLLSAVIFWSCSSGGGKFEGEWIPVEDAVGGVKITQQGSFVIKEENGAYSFYTKEEDGKENKMGVFLYDKENDILILNERGEDIDISYNKRTKQTTMNNNKYGESVELKRKK